MPAAKARAEEPAAARPLPEHKVRAMQRRTRRDGLRMLARVLGGVARRRSERSTERGLLEAVATRCPLLPPAGRAVDAPSLALMRSLLTPGGRCEDT